MHIGPCEAFFAGGLELWQFAIEFFVGVGLRTNLRGRNRAGSRYRKSCEKGTATRVVSFIGKGKC